MAKATKKQIAEVIDQGIRHEGKEIILPGDPRMSYKAAAEALMAKAEDEERTVSAHEVIEGNVFDALVAFHATLKAEFGWVTVKDTMSWFGPVPPVMLDVRTGPNPEDVIQVPTGTISAPNLGFSLQVHANKDGLHLHADLPKHKAHVVKELAAKARIYLASHSIYKGKAFKMPKAAQGQPEFISLAHNELENLILSSTVMDAVNVNLFTPIRKTAEVKAAGIPIKRTVVLAGKYGTGKSLTMAMAGRLAGDHGWTYVYLDDPARLAEALEYAKRYQPAIIAAEDIDRAAGERTDAANHIFNTLSGVLSGSNEVMVVLTTNHPDRIDKAMLRPGRIDAFIEVTAPDAEAVERLVLLYGRGTVAVNGGLHEIGSTLAGQIPATIREVVERAKLGMISRGDSKIHEADLMTAVRGMGPHLELLNSQKVAVEPTLDRALRALVRKVVLEAEADELRDMGDVFDDDARHHVADRLSSRADRISD